MRSHQSRRTFAAGLSATLAACATTQAQENHVTNIVLVHGAWADGAGWEGVYRALTAKGHKVSVVQNPLSSLNDDVAATNRVLARQDGPAFAPDAGESVSSLLEAGGGPPPPLQPTADGFLFFDPAVFPQAFAQDLPAERGAFMAASQIPTSGACFGTPITQAAWRTKPSAYVLATEDRVIPPPAQRQMATRADATITEVRGSHAVYVSQPDAVADAIDAAARRLSR
jgi:pimeloyl-ACP methyl ester carboxylesterase